MAELIWDGKYDAHGNKRAPVRIELPFQTVETVNESVQERQRTLELSSTGHDPEWRNRLIWGDKKYVLPSLLPEFAGKVDLIYIDPPFDTGADFSFTTSIPGTDQLLFKEPSVLEQKAYRDTWSRGLDSYLEWFYEALVLLRDLLAEDGSIYVHLDSHVGHYAKAAADEVFGANNFKNEIVWKRSLPHNDPKKYGAIHDTLLFYVKGEEYLFNQQFTGLSDEYKESHYGQTDDAGRRYQLTSLAAKGPGPARKFGDRTLEPPRGGHWRYSQEKIDELLAQKRIVFTSGGTPRFIRYMDDMKGPALQSIWTDIYPVNSQAIERLAYPTQKPEALLDRILATSSEESKLVLDCFVGSGTTAAVAEKLNRRWIACDLGRFAIHTTRKRLLGIPNVKPFVVQNLGKYERQAWQVAEFATFHPSVILSEGAASQREATPKSKDPMPAGTQQRAGKAFSEQTSARGARSENALRGRSPQQAGKGSFDSRTQFASESGSSAQDDSMLREQQAEQESRDPATAGSKQRPGREFSGETSGRDVRAGNSQRGRLAGQADEGSFDSATRAASGSGHSAQDDKGLDRVAQDDRGLDRLREQRERETAYRKFILELYHATPVSGHVWLHGVKGGRMVHVAAVDAPVTRADVNAIAAEVWRASGKGPNSPQKPAVDVLGWEFALDMNETAKQVAAEARVDAAFKKIPREVLEKKAVEQGDVYFFELGALKVDTKIKKRELTLTLADFVIPSDDVPAEVRGAIKHWSQMVDYWAVDWDFKDDTFHNQWQSYRTRKNPKIELSVKREYAEPGSYTVVVKVIDILGNDTTKMLNVEMK